VDDKTKEEGDGVGRREGMEWLPKQAMTIRVSSKGERGRRPK